MFQNVDTIMVCNYTINCKSTTITRGKPIGGGAAEAPDYRMHPI